MEDSIIQKTGKSIRKHKKKAAGISLATVVLVLQTVNILGPMLCSLPFVHDTESCLSTIAKAGEAAKGLHKLDGMTLDDGSPIMVETVEGGGDL